MDAATMTKQVADTTELDRDVAQQAIVATLQTLAERINGDEARHLAAQLPIEFQGIVDETASASEEGEPFGFDEFIARVGRRLERDEGDAARAARAVFDAVGASVASGEWGDVLSQLPNEYQPLFSGEDPTDHSG